MLCSTFWPRQHKDRTQRSQKLLANEVDDLQTKADYYLIHEHLEGINEPIYFYEFMQRAAGHQLQYLGESEYSMMLTSNFSDHVSQMVNSLAKAKARSHQSTEDQAIDIVQLEQYIDFVRNRHFRQTYFATASTRLYALRITRLLSIYL